MRQTGPLTRWKGWLECLTVARTRPWMRGSGSPPPTVEDDRLSRLRADPATGSYARNVCAAHEPGHPNRPTAHAVTDTQARSAVSTNGRSTASHSERAGAHGRLWGKDPAEPLPHSPPSTRPGWPILGIISAIGQARGSAKRPTVSVPRSIGSMRRGRLRICNFSVVRIHYRQANHFLPPER